MELPRGCQYWNNDEVRFMIDSATHGFHGCCYGLRQKFGDSNKYIKKPWRIVSWNVNVGERLSLKCDGRHEHAPCAGRETLRTQIYTSKIVSVVLEEQHRRCKDIEIPLVDTCTAGSSGKGNQRKPIALACVHVGESSIEKNKRIRDMSWITSQIILVINQILVPNNNENPNSGYSSPERSERGARRDPTRASPVSKPWRRVVLEPDHKLKELEMMTDPSCSFEMMTQTEQDM